MLQVSQVPSAMAAETKPQQRILDALAERIRSATAQGELHCFTSSLEGVVCSANHRQESQGLETL